MNRLKFPRLQGLIAAPFTPMNMDGSLNLLMIPTYYSMLKANGVSGAFICGSTGEGVSLTTTEKKAVTDAWASCTKNDRSFKVMLLLGGTSLEDCRELAIHAQQAGLYAVSFTAPFYFRPADAAQLAACCRYVAEAVPAMPFYYYHIPVLTGVSIPMISLLAEVENTIPNFAGIKYTHEDFMDFMSCLHFKEKSFDMLWGRDENMLAALAIGAEAAVGSTFNYAAPLYHQLIESFHQNDLDKARMLQQLAIDMIRLLGKYGGIATGKAFMRSVGIDCGGFRLPVKNMSDLDYQQFQRDLNLLNFTTFCSHRSQVVNHVSK